MLSFVPRMYTLGPMVKAEPISMAKKHADAICVLHRHSGINFSKPNPLILEPSPYVDNIFIERLVLFINMYKSGANGQSKTNLYD